MQLKLECNSAEDVFKSATKQRRKNAEFHFPKLAYISILTKNTVTSHTICKVEKLPLIFLLEKNCFKFRI